MAGLGQCASLHALCLDACDGVTDVAGLGQCASLHTLYLNACTGVTDVAGLGQCASLRILDLDLCSKDQVANLEVLNCVEIVRSMSIRLDFD